MVIDQKQLSTSVMKSTLIIVLKYNRNKLYEYKNKQLHKYKIRNFEIENKNAMQKILKLKYQIFGKENQ